MPGLPLVPGGPWSKEIMVRIFFTSFWGTTSTYTVYTVDLTLHCNCNLYFGFPEWTYSLSWLPFWSSYACSSRSWRSLEKWSEIETSCRENLRGLDMEYSIFSRALSLSTTCSPSLLSALALLLLPLDHLDQAGLFHPVKIRKWKQHNERQLATNTAFVKRRNM